MSEKLGISTGKGFIKDVYDGYAQNATNAENAESAKNSESAKKATKLADGWVYEGEMDETQTTWFSMGAQTADTYNGLYAIKLVDITDRSPQSDIVNNVLTFMISPDSSKTYTKSTLAYYEQSSTGIVRAIVYLLSRLSGNFQIQFCAQNVEDETISSVTTNAKFKVYSKKIF